MRIARGVERSEGGREEKKIRRMTIVTRRRRSGRMRDKER